MNITAKSANEAYVKILRAIDKHGILSQPRGYQVKELINANICIKNPRNRYIYDSDRKMSYAYAFGELCWYMNGDNSLDTIRYYSKFYDKITDDGKTVNSAYGYRIFGKHPQIGFDQWKRCVDLLKKDKDTRQAIIHIHTPNNKPTKDEVCTLTLQFLIRNGKLNMIVNMRSNDVVYGFTYDVFCFTAMQELMAEELGVKLGCYYHNAASLHIYLNDFYGPRLGNLLKKNKSWFRNMKKKIFNRGVPYIVKSCKGKCPKLTKAEMESIIYYEKAIRELDNEAYELNMRYKRLIKSTCKNSISTFAINEFYKHKEKRIIEKTKQFIIDLNQNKNKA